MNTTPQAQKGKTGTTGDEMFPETSGRRESHTTKEGGATKISVVGEPERVKCVRRK
jgi:hypothetical protein